MPKAPRRPGVKTRRVHPYPTIKRGNKPSPSINLPQDSIPEAQPTTKTAVSSKPSVEKASSELNTSAKAPKPASNNRSSSSSDDDDEGMTPHFLDIIKLESECPSEVPIYDTCSEVRRKIIVILKEKESEKHCIPPKFKKDCTPKPYTKADFARDIGVTRVLDTFMGGNKIMGGAESAAYSAAYCFFEKMRIFEGEKKTKGRKNMEEEMRGGLPLREPIREGENPRDFLNKYGQ